MVLNCIDTARSSISDQMECMNRKAESIAKKGLKDDPVKDVIDIKTAKRSIEINASVIRTADEMIGTLIDILA